MRLFTAPSIAEPSKHIDFIDGLRGVAVLLIILFHSFLHTHNPYADANTSIIGWTLSSGVPLFFVLSAYTLFLSSHARQEVRATNAFAFYARRMFRILPLWWIVCLYYGLFLGRSAHDTALSMTFLVGFLKRSYEICVTPVGWTLFVEESFYIFFPLWIATITSTFRAALAVAIVFLARPYYLTLAPEIPGLHPGFINLALGNYFAFFIGIFIWFFASEKKYCQFSAKLWVQRMLDLLAVICLVGVFQTSWEARTFLWAGVLLVAATHGTFTRRLCSIRPLTFIGGLSYGLYLIHHLVEHHITQKIQYHLRGLMSGEAEMIISWLITVSITSVVAWLSFTYFEKPIVDFGRRRLSSAQRTGV